MPDESFPPTCPACGYYLTTSAQFAGYRCIVRSHWAAAGLEAQFKEQPLAAALKALAAALLPKK